MAERDAVSGNDFGSHDSPPSLPRPEHHVWWDVAGRGGAILHIFGWLMVIVLGLVVLARMVSWDRWRWFADADSTVEVLFLPAWVVAIASLLARRWWLAAGGVVLCVAQSVYVLPEITASTPIPASVRTQPTIRVFDANVYQNNRSMEGYIKQMGAYRPDVVALEETKPWDWDQLRSSRPLRHLPFRYEYYCCGSRGFIVASRFPLRMRGISYVNHLAYLIRFDLTIGTKLIHFWVVHTTAPVNPDWNMWNQQLDGIQQLLSSRHPRPLLMLGDFNATWGNRGFRAILATGLTDAAAARGDPFAFTWSQLTPVLPPFVRIDHVLTGGDLTVTTISTEDGPGSEHRELLATVAIGPPTVAPPSRP